MDTTYHAHWLTRSGAQADLTPPGIEVIREDRPTSEDPETFDMDYDLEAILTVATDDDLAADTCLEAHGWARTEPWRKEYGAARAAVTPVTNTEKMTAPPEEEK